MRRVREVIVVEGRYDTARLKTVVDAMVVETNGFGLFKDKERLELLRCLAAKRGLLILTDSDSAGFLIRNYLSGALPPEQIKHAYIPGIAGKERRKSAPSREGLLGVEGVDNGVIEAALQRAGATFEEEDVPRPAAPFLTKADLVADGLSGGPDSAARREQLLRRLGFPAKLSANRLLEAINATMTREEYRQALAELGPAEDRGG